MTRRTGAANSSLYEILVVEADRDLSVIDFDDFKGISDTLGHVVGDECSSRSAMGWAPQVHQ
jgi:GGDEF domain-containing protein